MHSNQPFPPLDPLRGSDNNAGGYVLNSHVPPIFGGTVLPSGTTIPFQSLHGFQFQPSEACPKNFIIFDRTDNRRQIMFHPAIGGKFCYAAGQNDVAPHYGDSAYVGFDVADNEQREVTSSLKEDSDDIDALLSFDEEEQDESDEEEVSTARTDVNRGNNSPDSCHNYESTPPRKKRVTSLKKNSGGNVNDSGCNNERKRLKMRKMVRALRGIVPGANQMNMNTVAVLDEAVRYLKSLKVEMQKLGVGKSKRCT